VVFNTADLFGVFNERRRRKEAGDVGRRKWEMTEKREKEWT